MSGTAPSAFIDAAKGLAPQIREFERCVRDIHAAAQHITVAPANYQMTGQALLGSDMRASVLLFMDDRGGA